MGNCLSCRSENFLSFGGGAESPRLYIEVDKHNKPIYSCKQIKNKYAPYEGTLIQGLTQNGKYGMKVLRSKQLRSGNKDYATVLVYSYKLESIPEENGGTYAVLRFKESGLYFASRKDEPDKLILQGKKAFRCEPDPQNIKSPTDRRVFLMKPYSSSDVLFESVYATQKLGSSHVITLDQVTVTAELEDEVTSTSDDGRSPDSQRFQLFDVDCDESGTQSEEGPGQEEQRRD